MRKMQTQTSGRQSSLAASNMVFNGPFELSSSNYVNLFRALPIFNKHGCCFNKRIKLLPEVYYILPYQFHSLVWYQRQSPNLEYTKWENQETLAATQKRDTPNTRQRCNQFQSLPLVIAKLLETGNGGRCNEIFHFHSHFQIREHTKIYSFFKSFSLLQRWQFQYHH